MTMTLVLLILLSVCTDSTYAAIAEVAGQAVTPSFCSGTDTCTGTYPGNVTAGNLLVISGQADDQSPNTFAVSDSVGTTYSVLTCPVLSGVSDSTPFIIYGIAGGSGANTVTVNPQLDASVSGLRMAMDEFSGVHSSPLDVDGGSSTGTSTAPSDDLTTVTANALLIGLAAFRATATSITPGGSYTQIGEYQGATTGFNMVYRLATTAQAYTVDWTLGASQAWSACTAAFKPAGAAASAFGHLRRRVQ